MVSNALPLVQLLNGRLPQDDRLLRDRAGRLDGLARRASHQYGLAGGRRGRGGRFAAQDAVDVRDQRLPTLMALGWILREHDLQQAHTGFRHLGVGFARIGQRFAELFAQDLHHAAAVEGHVAAEHVVERGTERIDVGAKIEIFASFALLRAHVVGRTHHRAGHGHAHPIGQALAQSHVGQFGVAVFVEDDIGGFDVAVQHPVLVPGVGQGRGHPPRDGQRVPFLKHAAVRQQVSQCVALHVAHRKVVNAAVLPGLMGGHDVRMLQTGRHTHFLQETRHGLFIHSQARRQDLQRHVPVHGKLAGQVHFAHAAFAEKPLDPEPTHGRPRPELRARHHLCCPTLGALNFRPRRAGVDFERRLTLRALERNQHGIPPKLQYRPSIPTRHGRVKRFGLLRCEVFRR